MKRLTDCSDAGNKIFLDSIGIWIAEAESQRERANRAEAACAELNHCLEQLIPAERKWRKRSLSAEAVISELIDACTAALFPAGDTAAEVEAQVRSALTTAQRWRTALAAKEAELAEARELARELVKALRLIIESERLLAKDEYGAPDMAEEWECVVIARAALSRPDVRALPEGKES